MLDYSGSMTRPPGDRIRPRRICAVITLTALSAITGVVSYEHGLQVVRLVGNAGLVAFLVPLVPDLMIVTASLTLLEASSLGARRPAMSMLTLVAGIGWTVAMNVAAGWRNGPGGALIAAGIPLAFVLTFESLLWLFRSGRREDASALAMSACDHQPPLSLDDAIRAAYPVLQSQRLVAEAFGVSKGKVQSVTTRPAVDEPVAVSMNGSGPDGA